jgi:predicted esterase
VRERVLERLARWCRAEVTLRGGGRWQLGPDMYTKLDRKRFSVSLAYIMAMIEKEVKEGTPLNRIVVAGHGQGGCIATHVGLRLNEVA